MSDRRTGTVVLGSQTSPVPLPKNGSGTWTHGLGKKALRIVVVDPITGALYGTPTMVPTQPDSDTIVVDYNGTLESPATRNVVIIIDFDIGTPQQVTALPASAVVLS